MRATVCLLSVGAISGLISIAAERHAEACGGCFAPPSEVTTVDSHRMVISLGLEETVLWDQIVYSGDPEDFVWVLPVPSEEVSVELADSQFFARIDARTAPTIAPLSPPPRLFCPSGGVGCGAAASFDDSDAQPDPDGVTVFNEDVVGPYETVTIGAEDPEALYDWLTGNGYDVPPATLPAIDHYIEQQSVFVVMRLAPGENVQAMEPVRVRYPGYMASFPLKMVVVGAKGLLSLSLWVIAEQRYEARNYGTIAVDTDDLAWDWSTNTSNYAEVFDETVEQGGSRAWVVEYANLFDTISRPVEASDDWDIAAASVPNAYITRLRTRVLVDHIDQDLQLSPSADSSSVTNELFAPNDLNRPEDVDCDSEGGCASGTSSQTGGAASAGLIMLFGLALVLRRRKR
jgi:uncharacterized protein (TIGR03382 family)